MGKRKKSKKYVDPYAKREAEKYSNPIISREGILDYLAKRGKPVTREELFNEFDLQADEQREALRRRLRAMERDGQLLYTRRGSYALVDKLDLICGKVIGHKDGYGFLAPDDGSDDLFLSAREMRAVLDGDKVLARVTHIDRRGRREGVIVEVIERNTQHVVGRLCVEKEFAYVIPDNKRINQSILIPPQHKNAAKHGQIVVAEILTQPNMYTQAIGRVVENLGQPMAPGLEIDIAVRAHGIPHEWPDAVTKEITSFKKTVPNTAKKDRMDLRHLPLVTIDGEDAKDFDDAVYCEARAQGGWRLFVAIADVSHYVQPASGLDLEALNRGNSVYFPGEVIPMLPEILSNELCSLKPQVDRLSMVCEMAISKTGKITRYQFYPAVIHSAARLTYTAVAELLLNHKAQTGTKQIAVELVPHLQELYRLYQALRNSRDQRGAIDFETIETRIIFDEQRKIKQIVPVQRNEAHKVIEECMLAANVATARFLLKHKIPILYRVHEGPSAEKLKDLRKFLGEFGLSLEGGDKPNPADYAKLAAMIKGRPDSHLLQTVLLRSLNQAVYAPKNVGHFGLAFDGYTHFTSPIRRYPDLLVHRAIRHLLKHKSAKGFAYDEGAMEKFGEHSSLTERRADEASRDVVDWLKCEYMLDKVGEYYDGLITAVTGFGIFVELQEIYVEGLVHITALKNDYYHFDPIKHRLLGERTGTCYRLGDKIRVLVVRVNLEEKKLDFELAPDENTNTKETASNKSKPSKTKKAKKRTSKNRK